MGKPMYRWWDYVRKIVRAYPDLDDRKLECEDDIKDHDAVARAVVDTLKHRDGHERVELIRYVYWNRKQHRIKDAAPRLHISDATAKRWHGDFIKAVARNRGFSVNDTVKPN